jgi:uncharacterized protein (DUF983 family)
MTLNASEACAVDRATLVRTALRRGWCKRCPHCGQAPLYAGWIRSLDRCSSCGLVYERDQGDTWFFVNIGDRLFILPLIALIYFGIHRTYPLIGALAFIVIAATLAWTTPNRWGAYTALNYLSRVLGDDPDDLVPGREHL